MIREWRGVLHTLVGFSTHQKYGGGNLFNFILSNGTRSAQRDEDARTWFIHMIPTDAINKIRSVGIYYGAYIFSFRFFDKDKKLLWRIGLSTSTSNNVKVLLGEDEVIVGVLAKLSPGRQSQYTDF